MRVLSPNYENMLEEWMMSLLGQKMKAAQLVSGDEVTSALCDDEKGDFGRTTFEAFVCKYL